MLTIKEQKKMKTQMKELDKIINEKRIKERIEEKKEVIKNNDLTSDILNIITENKNIIFDKNNNLTTLGICFFIAIGLKIYNVFMSVENGN